MSKTEFDAIAAAAVKLFRSHGFKGVSQRAIASEVGIQAASLYHHCPGGKAELYVRSMQWFLDGYEARLLAARGKASFPESLLRMALHTLGENHVDLRRVMIEDLPNLSENDARQVSDRLHESLLRPFVQELEAARLDGKVKKRQDTGLAAACVLAIADNLGGLHLPNAEKSSPRELEETEKLVRSGVVLLLDGIRS